MNIFEFLGLPADYRPSNKVVMLVKHWDEVNKKALHKKVSFPVYTQTKKDGNFAAMVVTKDNEVAIFNRRGSRFSNVNDLESYWAGAFLPAGVYFGELCSENCSLEELSGVVNPNRTKPLDDNQRLIKHRLNIFFFDLVTICEFTSGDSQISMITRHKSLTKIVSGYGDVLPLQIAYDEEELEMYLEAEVTYGEEGIVIKQDVEWRAGAKDWHQMKKVRRVSYDLLCIGYEEGTGKYAGKVANLLFQWKDGKTVKAMLGKGWTHEDAKEMFDDINVSAIGLIFEVYALQESSKGLLRLPKVGERRHDKESPDA